MHQITIVTPATTWYCHHPLLMSNGWWHSMLRTIGQPRHTLLIKHVSLSVLAPSCLIEAKQQKQLHVKWEYI